MASVLDDRGYNQGFKLVESTRIRMQRRTEQILTCINNSRPQDVLEIGCGTGEVSFWLAESSSHKILGTDLCAPFIEAARVNYIRPNLAYEVVDFNNPEQVKGRKFDCIVGNGILHHLYPSLEISLQRMRQMLNDGGRLIFFEPNIYNPYCAVIFNLTRKWANLEPDEMAFSRRYISRILNKIGFAEIQVTYRDFLVPGVPNWLIKPLITIGDRLEQIWPLNRLSQSLFIVAHK
jgi:2-polyprenyl-3-methyl-5-hydroxy-6-metoxy-1,4-benzoquinol methylase